MNNDIKEILAYFEEYIKITDMHDSEPMLNWKDLKIVLDYITNLQEENERLKEDFKLMDSACVTFKNDFISDRNAITMLVNQNEQKDKEIGRLNNIIDELEKWLKSIQLTVLRNDNQPIYKYQEVLDKLKELKNLQK